MDKASKVIVYRRPQKVGPHWHTIQRAPLFVVLPGVAIILLGLNFVWEAVRHNASGAATQGWPLRFSLIDLATTTNLLAIAGGLMLARAQFAKTVQPNFGYSWTRSEDHEPYDWDLHFYNGGPGHATVLTVRYLIEFRPDQAVPEPDWIELPALEEVLLNHGLGPADVNLFWLGGAPIIPQPQPRDGFRLVAFSYRALALIVKLEVRITAEDQVGDRHSLLIRASGYLPRTARDEIARERAQTHGPS